MKVYIALLRGINVGGHNIVKMKDLRDLFQRMGLKNMKTYIQTGNIVFQSDEKAELLQSQIERELNREFGFFVNVMLRTDSEWEEIINSSPYPADTLSEGESVHLALLEKEPSNFHHLLQFTSDTEECAIKGREVYLFLRKSFRDAKIPAKLQKLGVPVTLRNWKTIKKLGLMANDMKL